MRYSLPGEGPMKAWATMMLVLMAGCGPDDPPPPPPPPPEVTKVVSCAGTYAQRELTYEARTYPSGDVGTRCGVLEGDGPLYKAPPEYGGRKFQNAAYHKAGTEDAIQQSCVVNYDMDEEPSGGVFDFRVPRDPWGRLEDLQARYRDEGSPFNYQGFYFEPSQCVTSYVDG